MHKAEGPLKKKISALVCLGMEGKARKINYLARSGNMVFLLRQILEARLSEPKWSSSNAITGDGQGKGGLSGVIKNFILNAHQQDSIIQSPVKPDKRFLKILLDQPQLYLSSPFPPDGGDYAFRQNTGWDLRGFWKDLHPQYLETAEMSQ